MALGPGASRAQAMQAVGEMRTIGAIVREFVARRGRRGQRLLGTFKLDVEEAVRSGRIIAAGPQEEFRVRKGAAARPDEFKDRGATVESPRESRRAQDGLSIAVRRKRVKIQHELLLYAPTGQSPRRGGVA